MREIQGRTRLEVSRERGLTPLVGREAELLRLLEAYQRILGGQPRIVLLEGDAGVGKSRLLYEFLRRLEGTEVLELEASCLSHTQSTPYHPVLQVFRRYLDLAEGADPEEVRVKILDRLRALAIDGEEPPILLGHFLGASASPEFLARLSAAQLKERTFAVLRTMLLRASDATPSSSSSRTCTGSTPPPRTG